MRPLLAALLLLLVLACPLAAPRAWADEPAPAPAPAGAPAASPAANGKLHFDSELDFGKWIAEDHLASALTLLPYVLGTIGLILLLMAWSDQRERRRVGLPPLRLTGAGPTVPFSLGQAGLLLLVILVLGALLEALLLTKGTAKPGASAETSLERQPVLTMLVAQAPILFVSVLVLLRRKKMGTKSHLPWRRVPLRALKLLTIAAVFVVPASFLNQVVLLEFGVKLTMQGPTEVIAQGAWPVALAAVVLAPIGEEGVFRGLLFPAAREALSGWRHGVVVAAVVVAFLFAGIHLYPGGVLPLAALALVLTWSVEQTDSLAVPMLTHGLWNLIGVLPVLVRLARA